jgi:NADH-dependent peroxiredoxin subunit F
MAEQPRDRYDVVVIGGGPAGSAAAIYTTRQGLATAVVAGDLGGNVQWASKIGNYLGFGLVAGDELARHFREHVAAFDIETFIGHVDALVPVDGGFEVYTKEGQQLTGRAVIIATGRAPARLAVPGEAELIGRGVSFCATCDGAFFRGRPAAVVGPGESAVDAALQLAALDAKVLLVNEKPLRASAALLAKLETYDNVELRIGARVTRILGEEQVTGIGLQEGSGDEEVLPVDAVFVETGSVPAEQLTGGLVQVNEAGEIQVDRGLMTSQPGVFAAGDITDQLGKQAIIAAGDGARAGVAAAKWLRER